MTGYVLDAGALIAFERNDRNLVKLLRTACEHEAPIVIPAGVVGQLWRDGRRQARLASFLAADGVEIDPLDDRRAREAGQLCGIAKTRDVVDASVVACARAGKHKIITSDPDDLARIDPRVELIEL